MDSLNIHARSKLMASINSKNTSPEMMIRKGLHHLRYRYRIHNKNFLGKLDLVFLVTVRWFP